VIAGHGQPDRTISEGRAMLRNISAACIVAALAILAGLGSGPREAAAQMPGGGYSVDEVVSAGSEFFGGVSGSLAQLVEDAASRFGLPNGYILGQTAGGAFIGGVRYGEGTLYTKNAGQYRVYWQGPSLGFDIGAEGSRTMMLVYNLPSVAAIYQRFPGVSGQAYLVGGLGMTVLTRGGIVVVPIISGIGARVGVNVGYLKFTDQPTWNPF
jgi:hypothetical protein